MVGRKTQLRNSIHGFYFKGVIHVRHKVKYYHELLIRPVCLGMKRSPPPQSSHWLVSKPHFLQITLYVRAFLLCKSLGGLHSKIRAVSLMLKTTFLGAEGGPEKAIKKQMYMYRTRNYSAHLKMSSINMCWSFILV